MALVSVAVAATELGVSRGTLYSLVRQKKIPHVRIGDRVLLSVEKVLAALEVPAEQDDRPSVVYTEGRRKRLSNQ
jgi:excisionase family DNA binding protein